MKVDIYEDKDNARKDEIAALGGQTATGTNVFSAFYDRLKEVCFFLASCWFYLQFSTFSLPSNELRYLLMILCLPSGFCSSFSFNF